jgi:hypothetical protein
VLAGKGLKYSLMILSLYKKKPKVHYSLDKEITGKADANPYGHCNST